MSKPTTDVVAALKDALAFTAGVWREAWGVQALAAAGAAALFVSARGRLSSSEAWDLWTIGWAVLAVAVAPLIAALLRLRLGGAALRSLGPAGLQLGLAELRLWLVGLAWAGATLLTVLPLVAISALCFLLFRAFGSASVPMLGDIRVSFLIAAAVWLAGIGVYGWALGRLSFALPATVARRKLVLVESWRQSERCGATLFWASLAALAPVALTLAIAILLDRLAVQDAGWGALSTWPLPDAILAGGVFGAVLAFVQAPLSVGVVSAIYCAERDRRRRASAAPTRWPRRHFAAATLEPFAVPAAVSSAGPS